MLIWGYYIGEVSQSKSRRVVELLTRYVEYVCERGGERKMVSKTRKSAGLDGGFEALDVVVTLMVLLWLRVTLRGRETI